MSNLFNKNNLRDIFAELNSETNVPLPEYVNIKNITTTENTSSFLPQKGGSFSITSANKNTDDQVNQLISMLTSESDDKHNFSANSTATEVLENRLRNMLQDGGAKKKHKKQRGGGDNELKECCDKLKAAGISVKLNDKTCSEYFGEKTEASALSELFLAPKNNSVKPQSASPRQPSVPSLNNETSSAMPNNLSPFLASPTSTQNGSMRQTATSTAMPNNMSSFLASPTSTQSGSVRQPSVRPTMTTSSEMPDNMSSFLASPTSTQGSANPLFKQYQPPAPNAEPNLLDSAVSATVETVQSAAKETTSFVGDLVNNVVDTVKGSVKAVVETVDKILEDSPSPSSEKKSPRLTGGGKKRKGSKKSKKSSKKSSKKGSRKHTGGGKKKSKKSSKKASRKGSKKGSRKGSKKMTGGGKKKSKKASKKASKKGSKKSSKKGSKKLNGGANAGFEAFLKLKKAVAEELGLSNGPAAGKAAGAAQREVKADHPDWDAVKVSEEALKLVKANPSKYKEMAK